MPITLLRVHKGAAAVLALLALSASLLLAALPRAFERSYDQALSDVLGGAVATTTDLTVGERPFDSPELLTEPAQFAARDDLWRRTLPPELRRIMASKSTDFGAETFLTPVADRFDKLGFGTQYLDLAWLPAAEQRVRYVKGKPPGPAGAITYKGQRIVRYDVAVASDAVTQMGLDVGATVVLGYSDPMAARVTGVYELTDPKDRYWDHHLNVPKVTVRAKDLDEEYLITGLTSADSLKYLNAHRNLNYFWVLGTDRSALTARDAQQVIDAIDVYRRAVTGRTTNFRPYTLDTGLNDLLKGYLQRLATAQTLMLLILGGLGLVAIGVAALAAQLLTERMRSGLTLMRARGGGLGQLVVTGTSVVALVTLPAVLVGYGLAALVPGPVTLAVHLGPALLAVAAIAYTAGRLALTHRRPLDERRDDVVARKPSPRRLVLEATVAGLALAGAYLLRTRGLQESDPFLMAVPAALTLAAALITVRCYPLPLRLFVWLTARRRPAVPFLGFTRAARGRSVAALPVLVLLPALAVSVFGSVVSAAVGDTQRVAAWQQVGASARVEREEAITPEMIQRIQRTPGVEAVVPVAKGNSDVGGHPTTVVAVDLGAYRKILAGTPLTVPDAPRTVPGGVGGLVSPSLGGAPTFEIDWPSKVRVVRTGTITGLNGLASPEYNLVVVPFDGPANTLLIKGGVRKDDLAAAVNAPDALIMTVDDSLRQIQDAPLTSTVLAAFTIVTIALGAYALIAVIIALVAGAADRAKALAYLRTLGLSQRQARGLTVLEVTPLIVLTAVAGLLLGLALPAALAPGIDLSAYAGSAVDGFPLTLGTPTLLAAGLTAVAVLGAFAHASAGRAVTGALRLGESA
ncbi:hypothetical protein J5X84_34855 [Streptosporangiaceae bacterium NEAU-GS5]|nr:hypothetical protein [Streptosporangiaceae bacterium NEAU-GS5]